MTMSEQGQAHQPQPQQQLSQEAFTIYCDRVMRDAAETNETMRLENASLVTALDVLFKAEIRKRGELVEKVNLLESDRQDDAYLFFDASSSTGAEFPLEELIYLSCTISDMQIDGGVGASGMFSNGPPALAILLDGTVELEMNFSRSVFLTGTLCNLNGTLEEVQEMIDCNQHSIYFLMLGVEPVHPQLGFPVGCLTGATIALKSIKIDKSTIHSILNSASHSRSHEPLQDEDGKELLSLYNANPNHPGLYQVIQERKVVEQRTAALKLARDLLQTVDVTYPGGSFRFKLEDCRLQRILTSESERAWTFDAHLGIPLASLNRLRFALGGCAWSLPCSPLQFGQIQFFNAGFVLKYSDAITAIFSFDSLSTVGLDNLPNGLNLMEYTYHVLSTAGVSAASTTVGGQEVVGGPEINMHLIGVQVQLDKIQPRLDLLGIEVISEEENEQS